MISFSYFYCPKAYDHCSLGVVAVCFILKSANISTSCFFRFGKNRKRCEVLAILLVSWGPSDLKGAIPNIEIVNNERDMAFSLPIISLQTFQSVNNFM